MAHLYFASDGARFIEGETVVLGPEESRHAAVVSRLREGEAISVGDGRGVIARAIATLVTAQRVELLLTAVTRAEPPSPPLWLVQALAKGGRDEQAIEQATEIGVSRVIPWQASRSVVKWDEGKSLRNVERWQKIVTEATKQSMGAVVPDVSGLLRGDEVTSLPSLATVIVLEPTASQSLATLLPTLPKGQPIALVVGPEGGVSPQERDLLTQGGASEARLGPGVLRASAAGPVALALCHQVLGHWD